MPAGVFDTCDTLQAAVDILGAACYLIKSLDAAKSPERAAAAAARVRPISVKIFHTEFKNVFITIPLCFYCNRTVEPNALFPRRFVGTWKLYTALVPSRKWIDLSGQIILLGIV